MNFIGTMPVGSLAEVTFNLPVTMAPGTGVVGPYNTGINGGRRTIDPNGASIAVPIGNRMRDPNRIGFRTVESLQPIQPRKAPPLGGGGASLSTVLIVGAFGFLALWLVARDSSRP